MAASNTIAHFDNSPFAEGRFRYAYKGTWTDNTSKPGQQCVIKKFKKSYTWKVSQWNTTVEMHDKAQKLASTFGNKLEYAGIRTCIAIVKNETDRGVKNDEYVVAEDYLEGNFNKWCNNYGFVSKEALKKDDILTAFMHWTWIRSGGEEMVADIQGVKTDTGEYKLTDPAIMSITNKYGPTDTGVEGMAMFFLTHRCTSICSGLAKPSPKHFIGLIPDELLQLAIALQNLSRSASTYTHEIQFTDDVRRVIITEFASIATGK